MRKLSALQFTFWVPFLLAVISFYSATSAAILTEVSGTEVVSTDGKHVNLDLALKKAALEDHYDEEKPIFEKQFFKKPLPVLKKPLPPKPIFKKPEPLSVPVFKKPFSKPDPFVKKPFPKSFPFPKKPEFPPVNHAVDEPQSFLKPKPFFKKPIPKMPFPPKFKKPVPSVHKPIPPP